MKKYVLQSMMVGLFLFDSLEAVHLENYDGFFGKYTRKIFGMEKYLNYAQSVQNVFEQIVPSEERKDWQEVIGKFGVETDDEGCYRYWIPINSNSKNWSTMLTIFFDLKPNKVQKKQFKDIDEAHEVHRRNLRMSEVVCNFTKINDKEAFYEILGETTRVIRRTILFGDWLVCLDYEMKLDAKNLIDWEKTRDFWIERFKKVSFE